MTGTATVPPAAAGPRLYRLFLAGPACAWILSQTILFPPLVRAQSVCAESVPRYITLGGQENVYDGETCVRWATYQPPQISAPSNGGGQSGGRQSSSRRSSSSSARSAANRQAWADYYAQKAAYDEAVRERERIAAEMRRIQRMKESAERQRQLNVWQGQLDTVESALAPFLLGPDGQPPSNSVDMDDWAKRWRLTKSSLDAVRLNLAKGDPKVKGLVSKVNTIQRRPEKKNTLDPDFWKKSPDAAGAQAAGNTGKAAGQPGGNRGGFDPAAPETGPSSPASDAAPESGQPAVSPGTEDKPAADSGDKEGKAKGRIASASNSIAFGAGTVDGDGRRAVPDSDGGVAEDGGDPDLDCKAAYGNDTCSCTQTIIKNKKLFCAPGACQCAKLKAGAPPQIKVPPSDVAGPGAGSGAGSGVGSGVGYGGGSGSGFRAGPGAGSGAGPGAGSGGGPVTGSGASPGRVPGRGSVPVSPPRSDLPSLPAKQPPSPHHAAPAKQAPVKTGETIPAEINTPVKNEVYEPPAIIGKIRNIENRHPDAARMVSRQAVAASETGPLGAVAPEAGETGMVETGEVPVTDSDPVDLGRAVCPMGEIKESEGSAMEAMEEYRDCLFPDGNERESMEEQLGLYRLILNIALKLRPPLTAPPQAELALKELSAGKVPKKETEKGYREVLYLAPWWSEAHYGSGKKHEELGKSRQSLMHFKVFLDAAVKGDARLKDVRSRIRKLEKKLKVEGL